jgi:hypothetical protein
VLSGAANFAIVSYGSYKQQDTSGRESADERDYGGFARTASDEQKITSAWRYIKRGKENMAVWADCASWDAATGGAERYDFNPMRTLGAVYKYARYTLAIVERHDAAWLKQAFQEYINLREADGENFAMNFMQESRANHFHEHIATNEYSFWNRAWILQEIFQSNAILYCEWSDGVLTPLGTGANLAKMASIVRQSRIQAKHDGTFQGWGMTQDNTVLSRLRNMATYLDYAAPPIHRARENINYNYQQDLFTAITIRPYYSIDRSNALQAIAVLLGLYVHPTEWASARAVHHAMIRMGALPQSSYGQTTRSQKFSNASWVPRYDSATRSTAELQRYFSSPLPGEMLPDGRLGLCGSSIEGAIMPPRKVGEHFYRDLSREGKVVATIPAICFTRPANSPRRDEPEPCIVLRTEIITFYVDPSKYEVIGTAVNKFVIDCEGALPMEEWRTRFLMIC